LGYNGHIFRTIQSAFGNVSTGFSYNNVYCSGNEAAIDDCSHADNADCSPDEAAGVVCDDGNISGNVSALIT
jgi:hypothetical protein